MERSLMWGKVSVRRDSAFDVGIHDVKLSFSSDDDVLSFTLFSERKDKEQLVSNRVVGKFQDVYLLPALPDRTLILKPKTNLSMLPSARYKFYVYLPVTFQLYAGEPKPESLIFEYALTNISPTWFGEPHDGELSYALYSSFDTAISPDKKGHNFVICPIEIFNSSKEVLDIKRLAIRGVHLNIYSDGEMLVSNKVKIKYLGVDVLSNVEFSKTPTATIPNLKLLSSARVPEDKTILKRSFQLIRHITQF